MEFRDLAQNVIDILDREGPPVVDGGRLWPIHVRPETGNRHQTPLIPPVLINILESWAGVSVGNTVSWGAMGDSFYEYLLKMWLLTGKKHDQCAATSHW